MQLLCPTSWPDYQLLDSGNGEKIERFGHCVLIRPEPKALWTPSRTQVQWLEQAHYHFVPGAGFSNAGKEDSGTWKPLQKAPEQWVISYKKDGLDFKMKLGLTAFKHVGVFPEQAPNWDFIYSQTRRLVDNGVNRPKVLNLFAYTGGASLAACAAGAQVVHLDAVSQVLSWGRQNMELSGLDGIRWMLEDAGKFVQREARRGNVYQGLILDPPAYGHGPNGERWKLDQRLFTLLEDCNAILDNNGPAFLVLNLYSNGYSALLADSLVKKAFNRTGEYTFGELFLEDPFDKRLPLSVFSRLTF